MSHIDSTREGQASPTGSGEEPAEAEKAAATAEYRYIKKTFDEENPLTTGWASSKFDPLLAAAFMFIDSIPAAAGGLILTQEDVHCIADIFPHYDTLIDDPDFYKMAVGMLNLFRRMYNLRTTTNIHILPAIEAKFQPARNYRHQLFKLWLLCLLGAPHEALLRYADKATTRSPLRQALSERRMHKYSSRLVNPSHSPLGVQRRLSFTQPLDHMLQHHTNQGILPQDSTEVQTSFVHDIPSIGTVSVHKDPNSGYKVELETIGKCSALPYMDSVSQDSCVTPADTTLHENSTEDNEHETLHTPQATSQENDVPVLHVTDIKAHVFEAKGDIEHQRKTTVEKQTQLHQQAEDWLQPNEPARLQPCKNVPQVCEPSSSTTRGGSTKENESEGIDSLMPSDKVQCEVHAAAIPPSLISSGYTEPVPTYERKCGDNISQKHHTSPRDEVTDNGEEEVLDAYLCPEIDVRTSDQIRTSGMEHSPVLSEISLILSESFPISLKHVQAIKVSGDVLGDTPAPVGMEFFCGSKHSAENASKCFLRILSYSNIQ